MFKPARTVRRFGKLAPAVLALVLGCSSQTTKPAPKSSLSTATAPSSMAAAANLPDLPEIPRDPREATLAEAAEELLGKNHVLRHKIDDAVSKEAFPKYIEEIDGGKMILLQSDVDALGAYSDRMDDELEAGNLEVSRMGAALMKKRRDVVAKLVADLLSKPFDFNVKESIETDPKKRTYCKTDEELSDRWRQELKLETLQRVEQMQDLLDEKNKPKSADKAKDKDPDEAKKQAAADKALADIPTTFAGREEKARKELAVRYQTRFTRLAAPEALQPAEDFINAVNAVYDPHTEYMAPAEKANFDIAITGTLEGIGAALGEKDHFVVVDDLVPGGASWQQGKLEAGDLILAVAQEGKDPVDVTDMPLDTVVGMIRGPKGTVVTLTVKKADGHIESIPITRDVIHVEATYARGAVLHLTSPEGKKQGAIGYIYLPGFYGDLSEKHKGNERAAGEDVKQLLLALKKQNVNSVVLDLRGNGGGLLGQARDISGLFIDKGPVVMTKDADGDVGVIADEDPTVTFSGDVVVMVDRFSASAAEILAGALQDYERAVIIGTSPTHGKGTVQEVVDLDKLGAARGAPLGIYKITTQEYFRVSGSSTQLKGITPDVLLPDPSAFVESGERTLFHPIPWSSIDAARFTKTPHAWNAADLQAASNARTLANPLLQKVKSMSDILKSRRDKTLEPLDLASFEAERKQDKTELDAADPKLKDQKPMLDVDVLPDPTSSATPTDKKLRKRLDSWKDDLARDPWVEEAAHVLGDMAKARPLAKAP